MTTLGLFVLCIGIGILSDRIFSMLRSKPYGRDTKRKYTDLALILAGAALVLAGTALQIVTL